MNVAEITGIAVFVLVVVGLLGLITRRVFLAGYDIGSVSEYLFARSENSSGLSKNTTVLTAIASNFQTANALFVGMWFGYNLGLTIAILSVLFASGIWLLYGLLKRLNDVDQKVVLQNTILPYERIFGKGNRQISNLIAVLVYLSIIFAAVTEVWFGSRMVNDAIAPMFQNLNMGTYSPSHYTIAVVALAISIFLFFYVFFGGYRAVAETDRIQTILIVSMLAILILGMILNVANNLNLWQWKKFFFGSGNNYTNIGYVAALFCGAAAINIFWQLVLPTQWQRAAASASASTYVSSLPAAAWGTVGTWTAPVLIGAIAAAANGANVGGVPTPFQGWYDLGSVLSINTLLTSIVVSVAIGIAVAGIFSAALSTADTNVIIVVAKLIQYQKKQENKLNEVRTHASFIVFAICILAGFLYYFNPPIDKFIFSVSTAQLLFAAFFWKYIRSSGKVLIQDRNLAIHVAISFALAFVFAIAFNFVPFFGKIVPNIGFWFPIFVLTVGFWLSVRNDISEAQQK